MELNPTSRLRRSEALNRPAAVRTTTSKAAERLQSTVDRLSLSQQATAFLEAHTRQIQEEAKKAKEREKENGAEDELSRALKVMKKCQEIAARIMSGGKVPPEDERYLMENDIDAYKLALAARKPVKHPKEYDSVLDEEDRRSGESSEDGAADSAESGSASASEETGEA